MHNQNIKILRLNDGEDIITDYHVEQGNIVVMNNPMTLFFKRLSVGKSMVLMQPWLPIELVDANCAKIYANQILTVIEPKSALIEYYKNAVEESIEIVTKYSNDIDESLLNDAYASSDDSDEVEDEEYTEDDAFIDKMQSVSNIKNKTIH
jgi:hypothetical protein